MKSRLEIYSSIETKDRAVIVGDRAALKELGQTLIAVANSLTGFETTTVYKGNGHDYEILVTKNIEESEWQSMPRTANQLSFVKEYNNLTKSLDL